MKLKLPFISTVLREYRQSRSFACLGVNETLATNCHHSNHLSPSPTSANQSMISAKIRSTILQSSRCCVSVPYRNEAVDENRRSEYRRIVFNAVVGCFAILKAQCIRAKRTQKRIWFRFENRAKDTGKDEDPKLS